MNCCFRKMRRLMSDATALHAPQSSWQQVLETTWFRRIAVLVMLAAIWEIAAILQNNPIMLPRFSTVLATLWDSLRGDGLLSAALVSVTVLLKGYLLSVVIALVLVGLAAANGFAREGLQTLTAMLNPLPAIALLPLAML